jgi:AcrR family transcriptional regulator
MGSSRDRIIESALGLIAEHGLGGVTMSAIAEEAGVTRQTLYNHFPHLDAIVTTVLEQHAESVTDELQRLLDTASGAIAKVEQLVRHTVANAHHTHQMGSLTWGLSAAAQTRIDQYTQARRGLIAGVIGGGIDEGVFRPDLDPSTVSLVIDRVLESSDELAERMASPSQAADLLIDMIRRSLTRFG